MVFIRKSCHMAVYPASRASLGEKTPCGRAEADVDASVDGLGELRPGPQDRLQHRIAIRHGRGHAAAEMQRHILAHRLERHRVLIDQRDPHPAARGGQRCRDPRRPRANDEQVGRFVYGRLLACDRRAVSPDGRVRSRIHVW